MKKILIALSLLFLVSCSTETKYGECVGIVEEKDPALIYNLSGWNIGMGVLFSSFIIPPVVVLTSYTYCPVKKREIK